MSNDHPDWPTLEPSDPHNDGPEWMLLTRLVPKYEYAQETDPPREILCIRASSTTIYPSIAVMANSCKIRKTKIKNALETNGILGKSFVQYL